MSAQAQRLPSEGEVLAKALLSSKEHLGLTNTELGEIIGKDRTYFTRLRNHNVLEPNSKEGELALHVIRIYRSLYALEGGDTEAMEEWLNTSNKHLCAIPKALLKNIQGLVQVVEYLDAMRGKV
ncbi:MAG: antitoxin Xre/MbcA/ParS toxin-binding domain-containing protein [Gammaproteobacteria bacterium]